MKRILIFTCDKRLARFYYAAHLRCHSADHVYRRDNVACYTVSNDDYPQLLDIADKLGVNHETIAPENRYRRTKRLIAEHYQPGQHFTTADVKELTGYPSHYLYPLMKKLVTHGYLETNGRTRGITYGRPEAAGTATRRGEVPSPKESTPREAKEPIEA